MKPNNKKLEEINKIKHQLIKRYKIYDINLQENLAISLVENGIGIDKFNKKYYAKEFDLDEIVYYLMNKELDKRENKIVPKKKTRIIKFYTQQYNKQIRK